jgi:phage tail-like protein
MAVSKKQIKNTYPLPAYNYRVSILNSSLSLAVLGQKLIDELDVSAVISCSEISGLNMELETVSYKDGMSFLFGANRIPAQKKAVNFFIKRGVVQNGRYFTEWMGLVYPNIVPKGASFRKRDVVIDLCNEKGEPVVRWVAGSALPTKLEAPTFDVNTNEVAFESIHLVAANLRVNYF